MKYTYLLLLTTTSLVAFDNSSGLAPAQQITAQQVQTLKQRYDNFKAVSDGYAAFNPNITFNALVTAANDYKAQYEIVFDKTKNRSILSLRDQNTISKNKDFVEHTIKRHTPEN